MIWREVWILFIFIPFLGYSQNGPGGIGNTDGTSSLVLWLNASNINSADGAVVNTWGDDSGNSFDFTNGNGAIFDSLSANGYPSLIFNGNSDYFQRPYTSALSTSDFTVLSANNVTPSNSYKAVVSNRDDPAGSATAGFILYSRPNSNNWDFWTGRSSGSWQGTGNNMSTASSWASQVISYDHSTNEKRLLINQSVNATNSHNLTLNPSRPYRVGAGRNESATPNYYFQGNIGEVIQYNSVLNNSELIIVNNYLSAKYGFNLGSDDLYVQDASGNGNFDHDVAGIGRINTSDLHDDSRGTGIVRFLNPSDLGDNEFLFWGHNNALQQATNVSDVPTGVQARFERVWRVSEVNLSSSPIDVGAVDIRFDLTGLGAVTASDLRLLVDSDNDGVFNDELAIAGASDLGGNIYEFSAVTEIENNLRFTLGTINSAVTPLPIELTYFYAETIDNRYVELTWQTSSEINNDYFTVERSKDLVSWEGIKTVDGAGNSNTTLQYAVIDESPFEGISYYRLKQTDFDYVFTYSEVETIYFGHIKSHEFFGFPNPTHKEIVLSGINWQKGDLRVLNAKGQDVSALVSVESISSKECLLDLSSLDSGVYLIMQGSAVLRISKY